MSRFRSVLVAAFLVALAFTAREIRSADFYDWGFIKEWHDANGNVVGYAYKSCPSDPDGAVFTSEGNTQGPATVVDRWMCDPVLMTTPDPCEEALYIPDASGNPYIILLVRPCRP